LNNIDYNKLEIKNKDNNNNSNNNNYNNYNKCNNKIKLNNNYNYKSIIINLKRLKEIRIKDQI
jgi:hypothetical protein